MPAVATIPKTTSDNSTPGPSGQSATPAAPPDERVVIAGIDEAGYGPILGPLVTSAVVLSAPAALADADLWHVLGDSVCRRPKARDPRFAIADSKVLSSRPDGLALLELAALCIVGAMQTSPIDFRAYRESTADQTPDSLDHYPWFCDYNDPLPVAVSADRLAVTRNGFAHDLNAADIRVEAVYALVLNTAEYNRRVQATDNKATVLFGQTLRLLAAVGRCAADRAAVIHVDRQGGRSHYRAALMTGLGLADLQIRHESDGLSAYEYAAGGRRRRIEFRQSGETHCLATAAASIISKYTRELFMRGLNRYWAARCAGLKPTAGYYQDGHRFLRDIAPALARCDFERHILVRQR